MPAWTGPEAQQLYQDWRCRGTFDVSGGWYDAGDYGKYATSGAIAVWQLLSTLDLLRRADHTPLAEMIRTECRWQLDWLLRMQVPDSDPLAGLVFHRCTARSGHQCPAGHTRTRLNGCCIGPRRRRACRWLP